MVFRDRCGLSNILNASLPGCSVKVDVGNFSLPSQCRIATATFLCQAISGDGKTVQQRPRDRQTRALAMSTILAIANKNGLWHALKPA
jgi:hypothetical protein